MLNGGGAHSAGIIDAWKTNAVELEGRRKAKIDVDVMEV